MLLINFAKYSLMKTGGQNKYVGEEYFLGVHTFTN